MLYYGVSGQYVNTWLGGVDNGASDPGSCTAGQFILYHVWFAVG